MKKGVPAKGDRTRPRRVTGNPNGASAPRAIRLRRVGARLACPNCACLSEVLPVPRSLRVALALGVCLIALTLYPADAAAQRGRGHVRVVRPVVYAGGWYAPYYYNPFWSYGWWGPWGWPGGYHGAGFVATSSARVQVTPRQTEVYVDGYLAGTVDDFDGFAQRLRVEPGDHVIELYLEGHRTISQSIYFQPGETYHLRHTMEPLGSGETATRPVPHPASAASVPPGAPRRRGPRGRRRRAAPARAIARSAPAKPAPWRFASSPVMQRCSSTANGGRRRADSGSTCRSLQVNTGSKFGRTAISRSRPRSRCGRANRPRST